MKSRHGADYSRLGYLTDYRYHEIDYGYLQCLCAVSREQKPRRPRQEHRSDAEHGQNIDCRYDKSEHRCIFLPDNNKSEEQLGKGEQKYDKIRFRIACRRDNSLFSYVQGIFFQPAGELACDKSAYFRIIGAKIYTGEYKNDKKHERARHG